MVCVCVGSVDKKCAHETDWSVCVCAQVGMSEKKEQTDSPKSNTQMQKVRSPRENEKETRRQRERERKRVPESFVEAAVVVVRRRPMSQKGPPCSSRSRSSRRKGMVKKVPPFKSQ